jgi:hypothetical protein
LRLKTAPPAYGGLQKARTLARPGFLSKIGFIGFDNLAFAAHRAVGSQDKGHNEAMRYQPTSEEIEALEDAYAQWRADYSHVHALAGLGDVFDLLLRLMAAYPKSFSSAVGRAPVNTQPSAG